MQAKLALSVLAALIVGGCVGLGLGYAHWRKPIGSPIAARREVLLYRAEDVAPGGVLILGDSITDRQAFSSLCGLPVFNAAISHEKAEDILPIAAQLVSRTRPARLILELGANDLLEPDPTPMARYEAEMNQLAHLAPHPVIVALPDDPAFPAQAARGNAFLRALAAEAGGTFIAPLTPGMTVDGVHPNARGRSEWKRRVNAACT